MSGNLVFSSFYLNFQKDLLEEVAMTCVPQDPEITDLCRPSIGPLAVLPEF